ncbi:DUF2188 domain-containing protein [Agromyces italicus]|uniref:DUF2188 domain-containing protein n=1 Tax=Agromyces italicus TaxID=279572 RepID=UPI0009FC49AB|nr:DUF2188 domain-containing protein [Agromyces italicus]
MPDYNVFKDESGWAAKREDASRASSRHGTQAEAYAAARDLAANNGGGDVSIHGVNGQIREKNTIAPAKDPRETRG